MIQCVVLPALRSKYLATKNKDHTPREAINASRITSLIRIHYKPEKDVSNPHKNQSNLFHKSYLIGQPENKGSDSQTYPQISYLVSQKPLPHNLKYTPFWRSEP